MNEALKRYKDIGYNDVYGWVNEKLFDCVDILDSANLNKSGGCLEIGVHHGKFYILLNQVIHANEQSYAVDVFDQQELNIDHSGKGSFDVFINNLKQYDVHAGTNTKVIKGDSTDSALDLVGLIGAGTIRFFSIDGGHTSQHTVNDLHLATKLIQNQGVVFVDDIFNNGWPGVIEGVCRFLMLQPVLVPFALGFNKLFMCKLSYHNYYINLFASHPNFFKRVEFFGHDMISLK